MIDLDRTGATAQETLAEFASGLEYSDIPDDVVDHAKLGILDTLGCALFGRTLPIASILQESFALLGHDGPIRVWGSNWTTHMDTAALINGTLAHSFELDDLHPLGILHPSGTTLPAVLAIAQEQHTSGRAVLAAHIAGLEVACRVGLACGQGLLRRGWHNNGVLGVFGATVASANARGLSRAQTSEAIGIAGSLASGLMAAQFGSMVKRLHAGQAAQTGLRASILAEHGFTGIGSLFENDYGGFLATFVDDSSPAELTDRLGTDWETMRVGFKMYPACASSHTSISVVQDLLLKSPFRPEDVEQVLVHCSSVTHEHVGWRYVPDSVTTAQMNLAYAVATTIANGTVSVEHYSDEAISDQATVDLAHRVVTVPEAEIDRGGRDRRHEVWMTVNLTDGRSLSGRETHALGSPMRPAPPAAVVEKFLDLASRAVGKERSLAIRDFVLHLEEQTDLAELFELLSPMS